jgi:NADPH-dependent 2,4-dienoyl-CoA reductase/sulfur reductase-like enzyme
VRAVPQAGARERLARPRLVAGAVVEVLVAEVAETGPVQAVPAWVPWRWALAWDLAVPTPRRRRDLGADLLFGLTGRNAHGRCDGEGGTGEAQRVFIAKFESNWRLALYT